MGLALQEAAAAFKKEEVPVGAIAVHAGRVVARAHNLRETLRDPTAHAEMLALTQAAEALDETLHNTKPTTRSGEDFRSLQRSSRSS